MNSNLKKLFTLVVISLVVSTAIFAKSDNSATGKGNSDSTGTSGIENAPGQNKDKDSTTSTSTTTSGKSANIKLKTSIEEYEVEYFLYYEGVAIEDGATKEIGVASLIEGDATGEFTIRSNSNMNSDLTVDVDIEATSFKTTLNDGASVYDSEITPRVGWKRQVNTIEAGKHMNNLIYVFDFAWVGNSNLPAGDYESDITITYSVL